MATKYAVLRGIQLIEENYSLPFGTAASAHAEHIALCTFDTPAYTAATDKDAMTFSGERDAGVDASPTLATAIQNQTRNGKTVTIRGAVTAHAGLDTAGLAFYAYYIGTTGADVNISSGIKVLADNLWASLSTIAAADQTTAASAQPITLAVAYSEAV